MKPMLAKDPVWTDEDVKQPVIPFPVLVQPKLDGIRALVVNGKLVSRNLKPIPNAEIRAALERPEFEGFDGELLVGDPRDPQAFQIVSSYVRGERKTGGDWTYNVFDLWNSDQPDRQRQYDLIEDHFGPDNRTHILDDRVVKVPTTEVQDAGSLAEFEAEVLKLGFEGAIARDPNARYKFGRSTPSKGPLWKIKRFIDFEAEVIGVYEEMHNGNVGMTNALGRTERSSAAAGKTGKGTLGGLVLRAQNGPHKGQEFRCGTGFTAQQRALWWPQAQGPNALVGRTAKIKSFPIGVKDAPRFPVWLGWREDFDR